MARPPQSAISAPTVCFCNCKRECWKASSTRPICRVTGRPASSQRPAVGSISPAMIQASVDLPEPFPPTTSSASPRRTTRSMPCRAGASHGVPRL
ncbi:Uncharacterised protein [Mycobacteroides abscessus subsp. abscessus]|nr:Uncharacterised protein [Mycobacteroides abscessus subsp. abscessus]